jgi:hypothetical protein
MPICSFFAFLLSESQKEAGEMLCEILEKSFFPPDYNDQLYSEKIEEIKE